jgi:phosphate-selective porin
MTIKTVFVSGFFYCLCLVSSAQDLSSDKDSLKATIRYGDKGFEFRTGNNNYLMQIQWRLQTRIAYPFDSDPVTFEDFEKDQIIVGINRARMKVGGHAFSPRLQYYLEYELWAGVLLDYRLMYEVSPSLNIKIGQWKTHYTRERVISSGKQQTLDRSILNYAFTLDRQQGISFYGRLDGDGMLDFNYWFSTLTGTGRGSNDNDDTHLLYMGRWQWNPLGTPVPFTGSDLRDNNPFILSVALAAATNRSPYTRFSTSGGGQLPGFEEGIDGQYRVNQWLFETSGMVGGFSWQQEFHWKEIRDKVNLNNTILIGNLLQLGYFPSRIIEPFPKKMELFARYAFYDPDRDISNNYREEITIGANWFFREHRNKLTLEFAHIHLEDDPVTLRDGSRIRLQWDISL